MVGSKKLRKGVLRWDVRELARALKIPEDDVREYFTNGRRVSFIVERRIAREVFKGAQLAPRGAGFDFIDEHGGKWEVRCITQSGIYFCPSYMVGSGRHFDEEGFLRKLSELEGYVVADVVRFPEVPFWVIPSEQVREWWEAGELGSTTKISRDKMLELLASLES